LSRGKVYSFARNRGGKTVPFATAWHNSNGRGTTCVAQLGWGASTALPAGLDVRQVRPNGEIYWQGRSRFIGEAFVRQPVGFQPWRQDRWRVYFYDWLIGEIHTSDLGAMRPTIYHRRHPPKVSAMS